jgi:EAL domain-containing protein (putative c-di-GMP-specific phosphodiesterase class I)
MTAQFEDRNSGLRQVISENFRLTTQSEHNAVPDILHAVRQHLKMDVAFVAEFIEGHRVFRYVDSEGAENPVQAGFGHPLEETYCQRVVDKRLPELMQNAQENPVAVTLALTASLPIGAYLSVPLRLSDGSLYGTFCCFSHSADYSLNERDLSLMRTFAELAAKIIDRERLYQCKTNADRERIVNTLKNNTLSMVYQPIFDLIAKQIVGFESLMRFPDAGIRTSEHWFNEAHAIGLGVELETRAISLALEILPFLKKDTFLTINTSPELIMAGALEKLLSNPLDLNHLVLEITEHAIVYQYKEIAAMLAPFRKRGLQIAVDDAGAGYASFRHILNLAPDRIKLDMSLTRDIDTDPARRALTVAFVHFSSNTGSKLIAEGVETAAELVTLQELGVTGAQGYFLGRPMSMYDVLQKR